MSDHEIVVLGANFGGVGIAHYLLRHTIPALKIVDPAKTFHLTLVGPSKSFYFKVAAPRVLADPASISFDKATVPLEKGFGEYDASIFEFVQGLATALDADKKIVTVTLSDKTTKAIHYDSLVIATGTTADPLWTLNDDLAATKAAHEKLHENLPKAKSILVAGGGPAGVETTGEIATKFSKAKITLLSGTSRVLPRLNPATSKRAVSYLTKLGVTVKDNLKVTSAEISPDGTSTKLKFDDGTEEVVDVYIAATGGKPNTSFLPASWLDESGRVKVEYSSLRGETPGIYGLGDVANYSSRGIIDLMFSTKPLAATVGRDIVAQLVSAAGGRGGEMQKRADSQTALKNRPHKPPIDVTASQIVPIGPKGGVGQVFGFWLPSFLVQMIKGKDFMIGRALSSTQGADWVKA